MTLDDPPDQGWKRTAAALVANPFERFELAAGGFGWVYRYRNVEPLPIAPITTASLELAVQLAGDWSVSVWGEAPRVFGPGEVFVVPPLVRHRYGFEAIDGCQVGFALPAVADGRRLGLGPLGERWRRRLVDLAHDVAEGRLAEVGAVLAELVDQRAIPADPDPVERARVLLTETSDRPLYLDHVADEVGLHPKTLTRRFVDRVGVTPIRFRTELRLQRAIRLLWSRPDLSIARVADEVGFADPRFFHRLAVATFRMTPAQLGRRATPGRSG